MDNLTNASHAQATQLTTNGLMPRSWSNGPAAAVESLEDGGNNSWYNYAPTRDGFQRYIQASGSNRNRIITRNPLNRLGVPNPLRTMAPAPMSSEKPWFNDSSYRLDINSGRGCGFSQSERD